MWLTFAELGNMHQAQKFAVTLPFEVVEMQGEVFTPLVPAVITLALTRALDKIEVTGEISGRWLVACVRCLTPAEAVLENSFDDMWWPFGQGEESEDFLASDFVDNDRQMVNLETYGTEIVLAHLPLRVLCAPDCLGICESCGQNLNEAECNCAKRDIDPRLAVLGRLLNDKGGVLDGTTKKKNFKVSPR